jgi:hypothetical protein
MADPHPQRLITKPPRALGAQAALLGLISSSKAAPLTQARMTLGEYTPPRYGRRATSPLLTLALLLLGNLGSPSFAEDGGAAAVPCSSLGSPEADDVVRTVRQSRLISSEFVIVSVYSHTKTSKVVVFPVLPSAAAHAEAPAWPPMMIRLGGGLTVYMLASHTSSAEVILFVEPRHSLPVGATAPLSAILDGALNTTIELPESPRSRASSVQVCAEVVPTTYEPRGYAPRAPHGG